MQVKGFGCLHYAMTQSVDLLVPSEGRHNVYFLIACASLMQSLGMSTLCRDSDLIKSFFRMLAKNAGFGTFSTLLLNIYVNPDVEK